MELQEKLKKEREKRHEEEKERKRLRDMKNKIENERDSESTKKEEAEKQRSEEQEKREQLEREIRKANEEKNAEANKRLQLEAELKEMREEQDWSIRSSTLKRRSNFLEGSITEEGSVSDINPSNDRLAYRVRKASTPIEKGKYENLNIFKPRFQTPSEMEEIRLYGEENDKTTKTILVIGAKNRGRKTFTNTLVNHLWDVKISSDRFRFKVAFDPDPNVASE